jgi:NAD(P)-dependent dehydrogenase (short-subunit alcohol dehydrogenase family)
MKANEIFAVDGKVVIVTGAASGIGRMIAETLTDNGAYVVLADRDEAGLRQAVSELAALGTVETKLIDVSDPDGVIAAFDEIAARLGRIDVVFANAGVSAGPGYGNPAGALDQIDFALFEGSNKINLSGAVATMKAAAKHMKAQRSGSLVVTTSTAALSQSALPGYGYFAGKAGLAQVVRVAANELAPFNVRVNGIAPGAFPTNMAGGRLREPEAGAKFAAEAPMNRIGRMEEIAGVALLLASDASSYMTGANIPVDGGVAAA